ncbi:MAG: TIGR03759 family integrating conjugative element protein [Cellvibrionaceae bacterium]
MKQIILLLICVIGLPCLAEDGYSQSTTKTSELKKSIEAKAILWGITQKEYRQYLDIIQGPLGKWNPNIDPLLALGMYVDSDIQRQYYAERYAVQEHELTERAQRFQRDYSKAFARLYPDAKIIDPALLKPYYDNQVKQLFDSQHSHTEFLSGDRLLYFADLDCQSCSVDIKKLETLIQRNAKQLVGLGVDIYLLNTRNKDDVIKWAKNNHINRALVDTTQMTLNIDNGLKASLNAISKKPSDIYLYRNDKPYAINRSELGL